MRLWDVGFVAARIAAIYLAVRTVVTLSSSTHFLWTAGDTRWPILIAGAVSFLLAWLLWQWSESLADHIAFDADELRPEDPNAATTPAAALDHVPWFAVAFAVAGIVVAVEGVVNALGALGQVFVQQSARADNLFGTGDTLFLRSSVAHLVVSLAQAGIGLWLFAARDRLARVVHRPSPEPQETP